DNKTKAQKNIEQSQLKQKNRHDKNLKEAQFKRGDSVLLYKSNLRDKRKLEER
ncbi:3385_t:CDS:1, partial [Funneliformis geosporum]